MIHGVRRSYQHGCRCADCRAANAAYFVRYRAAYRSGRVPLGARVHKREAERLVAALLVERFRKKDLAFALGKKRPGLQLGHTATVTIRTVLALRWLHRYLTA